MTANRETMTGRMYPTIDPDRRAATRAALLWVMFVILLAVAGHAAHLLGIWLSETFARL